VAAWLPVAVFLLTNDCWGPGVGCIGVGAGVGVTGVGAGVGVTVEGVGGVGVTGAGVGATEVGKLLVTDGTMGAGVLVLEMATPPSTTATMLMHKEKMNMKVTCGLGPLGAGGLSIIPTTSTSIRFISDMERKNRTCGDCEIIFVNMRPIGSPRMHAIAEWGYGVSKGIHCPMCPARLAV